MMSDTNNIFISTFWSAFGVYANRILSLIVAAILSRLLTPNDFGVIAMITVVSGFMILFAEPGIGSAVVQFRNFNNRDHQTIFTLTLFLGLLLALLLMSFGSHVASFYDNDDLKSVAMAMAITFPLSTIGIVPLGILQRDMRFREISIVRIVAALIAGIIGIVIAYCGGSYWALVVQILINGFISSCAFMCLARLVPFPRWDFIVLKKIFSFSGNLTLFSMINYWARNLDNLLIGKFIGSTPLGYYNRAYQLMVLPLTMLTYVVTPVLHSVMADKQNDLNAMYRGYIKVVKFVASICMPTMTYVVILSPELIRVVWGSQWEASIPIFAILGLNGLFQPIVSTTGTIFMATNKTNLLFVCGILTTIIYCLGISVGLQFGIKGVAIGYTLASCLIFLPLMYFVFVKLLKGKMYEFISSISKPLLFSVLLTPILYFLCDYMRNIVSGVYVMMVTFVLSFSIYIFYLFFYDKETFKFCSYCFNSVVKNKINE